MAIKPKSALLIVDMQNDFLPGGALAVPGGDVLIPVLNEYIRLAIEAGLPVIATRDWHPEQTAHFTSGGGKWPPHCVQNTWGAKFHPDLAYSDKVLILSKGMDPQADSYSAFDAQDDRGRPLAQVLSDLGIEHLYIGGLALDYCVRASALDALQRGLGVTLLIDATRAVNLEIHDGEKALEDIVRAGGNVATIEQLRA
ncbi:MAG: nicotinamidase [Chloroflexi bacterium]|nr:nicotinamidase [Chloroflexota bacterium]